MKRIAIFARRRRCRRGALSWRCFTAIVAAIAMAEFATAAEIDFNRDVRPILSDRCFACHGPDEGSRESGMNLEAESEAAAELASGGRAIVPGKPEESLLLERVKSDDESYRMPLSDDLALDGRRSSAANVQVPRPSLPPDGRSRHGRGRHPGLVKRS